MNVHRRIDRLARLLCIVAIVAFLPGCLTPRTAFETVGEIPLADPAATADIHAWTGGKQGHGGIVQESDTAGTFFRFPSSGWSTLAGSLVGDLRMSFSVRLEAPVEYEIPTAMLNFRNYFDRRYCFLVEPTSVSLLVARVHHGELTELARFPAESATNAWYGYEIVAVGPSLKVFRSGRLIMDLVDTGPPIGEGNIAFESHSKYSFRDVEVARIEDFRRIEKAKGEQPPAAIPLPTEKLAVAVSGFENRGVEGYAASLITDLYASALLSTGVFRVVERSQTARVLAEQEFQLSDVADAAQAVTIGRILNTKYLSSGSVGMLGTTYVLTVAMVDVETGETIASFNRSFADTERIPASMDELCAEIARKVVAR
jgi:TolB-like protein